MHHQLARGPSLCREKYSFWEQRKSKLYECEVKWRKDHMGSACTSSMFVPKNNKGVLTAISTDAARGISRRIHLLAYCSFGPGSFKLHREIYAMSAVRVKADDPPRGQ